ncbi:MAG: exopolysaccharide biosynthesis protein [Burkholderiaceae bacterium]|nr:exopolysaccharide biosynthesis protein [Burkholderiaceae bacterium]
MLLFQCGPTAYIAHANLFLSTIVANKSNQTLTKPEFLKDKRRATVERIAGAHLASMDGTLADSVGKSNQQRLVWLGLLAMPLIFPIALPGMSSMVGAVCLLIAYGLCIGQPVPLPGWLAKREINGRVRMLLKGMINRAIHIIALWGRPRMLSFSNKPARVLNGLMLSAAGVSMMIPVPIISFDNVLPALAIVLLSWGIRLRDGLMLLVGYLVTLAAIASVMLLWWGGTYVATELLSLAGLASSR